MSIDESKKTINPFVVYSLEEVSEFLNTDPRTTSKVIRGGELTARKVGQGYKILGENILRYLGSAQFDGNPSNQQSSNQAEAGAIVNTGKNN